MTTHEPIPVPRKTPRRSELDYPPGIPEHICDAFEKLTLQLIRAGHKRYAARGILHTMRWHYDIKAADHGFKIPNKHSPRLARWFMAKHPQFIGFFVLRPR